MNSNNKKRNNSLLTFVGLVMCVVFGFLFICNMIIIVKGTLQPEIPPSIAGVTPMVVLSGSMSGDASDHIEVGDLIFVSQVDTSELKEGDIIAFCEPNSTTVVTHRIQEIQTTDDNTRQFITKGDANNTIDQLPVNESQVIGIYRTRIPKVGNFAMFLQTPLGMVIFVGGPIFAFIIYDMLRRQHETNKNRQQSEEMEAELERLRLLVEANKESKGEEINEKE